MSEVLLLKSINFVFQIVPKKFKRLKLFVSRDFSRKYPLPYGAKKVWAVSSTLLIRTNLIHWNPRTGSASYFSYIVLAVRKQRMVSKHHLAFFRLPLNGLGYQFFMPRNRRRGAWLQCGHYFGEALKLFRSVPDKGALITTPNSSSNPESCSQIPYEFLMKTRPATRDRIRILRSKDAYNSPEQISIGEGGDYVAANWIHRKILRYDVLTRCLRQRKRRPRSLWARAGSTKFSLPEIKCET